MILTHFLIPFLVGALSMFFLHISLGVNLGIDSEDDTSKITKFYYRFSVGGVNGVFIFAMCNFLQTLY